MPNRLTKIYTRTGDKGSTRIATGESVPKTHPRIEALGDIDELNSLIGVLIAGLESDDELVPVFRTIQHCLFDLGGELAMADESYQAINSEMISELETTLDRYNETLPPLKEFILPGGSLDASRTHLARSICRRSERRLVALAQDSAVSAQAIAYLNRLSDLLFVLARVLSRRGGQEEILWQPAHKRKSNG